MRKELILLSLLLCAAVPVSAQVSLSIRTPNVSIGINVPIYPRLVRVPSYPVYYAPELDWNYFFYDGEYWVYQDDNWYASSWYDGPWEFVEPAFVPLFILRIPVRYYRLPPVYFRGWRQDAPPRWNDHWGNNWAQRRSGWDRWERRSVPAPAPLPLYQRQYSGDRYPRQTQQQQTLRNQHYGYQPREELVRQRYQPQRAQTAPAPGRAAPQDTKQPREQQREQQRQSPQPPEQRAPEQRARQREQPPGNAQQDERGRQSRDQEEQQKKKQEQRSKDDKDRGKGDERGPDRR